MQGSRVVVTWEQIPLDTEDQPIRSNLYQLIAMHSVSCITFSLCYVPLYEHGMITCHIDMYWHDYKNNLDIYK